MAQPVYSILMFGQQGVRGENLVNVPPGKRWIVRDIDAYCNVGEVGDAELYVGDFNRALTFWYQAWFPPIQPTEPGFIRQWRGRQVIDYADGAGVLKIVQQGTTGIDVMISGYELTT
jgi:hypothetical protein